MTQDPRLPEGRITVICGPVFCGKSDRLIGYLCRARIGRLPVVAVRYGEDGITDECSLTTHDKSEHPATWVSQIADVLKLVGEEPGVVGIDDVHRFEDARATLAVCDELAAKNHHVIVAGLDLDFEGRPFETMQLLLATGEEIVKIPGVCRVCHSEHASRSQKLQPGGLDQCESRCRHCFKP